MSAPIFINYRREDSSAEAMLVRDAVRREFGDDFVFMDTASIHGGDLWPDEIETALRAAKTVLPVVGLNWLQSGSENGGPRRLDQEDDWVRKELILALSGNKRIIPVFVKGVSVPARELLPDALKPLFKRQGIPIRRDYWDHDVKLLLAQLAADDKSNAEHDGLDPYPKEFPIGPDAIAEEKLQRILNEELTGWKRMPSQLPENPAKTRIELAREFTFKSFAEAIRFMGQVSTGCDIAMHHPRWENIWRTLRVYLTTWDIGHRISDRDIQLARYFDRAFDNFPGADKTQQRPRLKEEG